MAVSPPEPQRLALWGRVRRVGPAKGEGECWPAASELGHGMACHDLTRSTALPLPRLMNSAGCPVAELTAQRSNSPNSLRPHEFVVVVVEEARANGVARMGRIAHLLPHITSRQRFLLLPLQPPSLIGARPAHQPARRLQTPVLGCSATCRVSFRQQCRKSPCCCLFEAKSPWSPQPE